MADVENILGLGEGGQRHRCHIRPGDHLALQVGGKKTLIEKAGLPVGGFAHCRQQHLILRQIGKMRKERRIPCKNRLPVVVQSSLQGKSPDLE